MKPRADVLALTNGSGVAAIISAALGCFILAILSIFADHSVAIKNGLVFYKPTGPLSGVTTIAVLGWLVVWATLEWRWGKKSVAIGRINAFAFALLALSLVLTFPPVGDLF